MMRRKWYSLVIAFITSLCMIFWGRGVSAEGENNSLERMFGFIETGIPDCVDVSEEYVTTSFVAKFRKVLTLETGISDGGVNISKERLAVADCGAFYTVTTTYPKNEEKSVVELGRIYVFFFVKSIFDDNGFPIFEDNGFPNGNFSNYVFIFM